MTDEPRGSRSPDLAAGEDERHPAPELLAAFAAGTAGSAAAKEILRHLLRGCRACSRAIGRLLPVAGGEGYERALDRAFAISLRGAAPAPLPRDDRAAAAVLAVVAELAGRPPLDQCARLLAAARGLRESAPRWVAILCAFALAALEPLDGERAHDLGAALWAEIGHARRLAGELDGAAAAFACAHRRFAAGGGDRGLYAEVLELYAGLLLERGDAAGAAAMLGRAAGLFAHLPAPAAGRALVARGVALAAAGEPGAAAGALVAGLERLAVGHDPSGASSGLLHLALVLVRLGRPALARPVARLARRLKLAAPAGDLPRERLLEGEVAAALGDTLLAARALSDAREGFAAAGRPYEALHATLRAAELELDRGRRSRAAAHLADALLLSSSARVVPEGHAALASLADAVRRGRAGATLIRATASEVRRLGARGAPARPALET